LGADSAVFWQAIHGRRVDAHLTPWFRVAVPGFV